MGIESQWRRQWWILEETNAAVASGPRLWENPILATKLNFAAFYCGVVFVQLQRNPTAMLESDLSERRGEPDGSGVTRGFLSQGASLARGPLTVTQV